MLREAKAKALIMNVRVTELSGDPASHSPAKAWLRALEMTAPIAKDPTRTLPAIIDELADRYGEAPALLSDRECLSYHALAARANRYARWALGADVAGFARLDRDLERHPDSRLAPAECRAVTIEDKALYIYTSGTTGLPKAANVSHARVMMWSHWFAGMMGTQPSDRMYDCLPMYHSVGGVVATGALLVNGGSVVLREKFSARQFWDDVARWDCTLIQYIG